MKRNAISNRAVPFAIDRMSPVSLTQQVSDAIRCAIDSGAYDVGTVLPPRKTLSAMLRVSECVVRSALAILASDGLVVPRAGIGCTVVGRSKTKRRKVILEVSAENFGSFSPTISSVEFARAIRQRGYVVVSLVLGVNKDRPFVRPLTEALRQKPDFVLIRMSVSAKTTLARLIADSGCPYATMAVPHVQKLPGRFLGDLGFDFSHALSDFAASCKAAGVKSALQVDYGGDTYLDVERALSPLRVGVERLAVSLKGPMDLDRLADEARAKVEDRLRRGALPDLIVATDDYLSLGIREALLRRGLSAPEDIRLVVYANRGSGLFPFSGLARFEYDPRRGGREAARCVLQWLDEGKLGQFDNPHAFVCGRSLV